MSLSQTTSRNNYIGTGATSVYAYQFKVFLSSHLTVVKTLISTGAKTPLVEGVDYSVSGVGNSNGGNVTLTAGNLAATYSLAIYRQVPLTQLTSFRNQGGFYPSSWEDAVDYAMMVCQELKDLSDRSLKLPDSEQGSDTLTVVPPLITRISTYLGFDGTGKPTNISATLPTAGVSAYMVTLLAAASASAARILLGFAGSGGTAQTANIEDNAITTAKVLDGNVTNLKLADAAVSFMKLGIDAIPKGFFNVTLNVNVFANALQVTMYNAAGTSATAPVAVNVRGFTAGQFGTNETRTSSASIVGNVSAGSTLGHVSGVPQFIYVYAVADPVFGLLQLAFAGSRLPDENVLVNTTAEGGAGAADSATVLYSATALTGAPCRFIGRITSNQAIAGTWASNVTDVQLGPISTNNDMATLVIGTGAGHGGTNTKVRRIETAVSSTGTQPPVAANSAANGTTVTIAADGLYSISYSESGSVDSIFGVSLNSAQLTTSITTITAATKLIAGGLEAATAGCCSVVRWLKANDVIRAHTDGNPDGTTSNVMLSVTRLR